MKRIYVIRHCEAEEQQLEARLTSKGGQQAETLARFLSNKDIERIISSPFVRAIQSIQPLAEQKDMMVELDERLSERILSTQYLPDWLEKLKETFDDLELKFDGGESSGEAMNRVVSVVKEVVQSDVENTLIVTHGNLMSLLLKNFQSGFGFEEWRNLSNPDVFLLQFLENDEVTVERLWVSDTV
ncbi:histidine phosphatase family protein [Paenibacillus sp. BSR1-1]|uniref:histidine phosphatase family protein n=1 Tax=Paenibacillus sp. BSR1-1 TaxID=3020845 RepID=UPI0025B1880A|nr:histidine phosphatase family protein [Paenibacillus sp. BSR1-1]MDN3017322.1 histidine phosphatase family protein [Paenibacillus sp. BSR1-1]